MSNSHDFFKKCQSLFESAEADPDTKKPKVLADPPKDAKLKDYGKKEKADKDADNYEKGNVRANWGDKAEGGPGSGKKKTEACEGFEPPKDWKGTKKEWTHGTEAERAKLDAEEEEENLDYLDARDKEKAEKKAAKANAKKPANVKETAGEFFRRYADIITEAEEDDDEDPDVAAADKVKGKDGATQSDAEKKLPPWLQKKDAFDKKDKKAEDKGAKAAKKDKDI